MVVADAETHDDLQIRQAAHQRRVDGRRVPSRDDGADARRDRRERRLAILRAPQPMQRDALFDRLADFRHALGGHQHFERRHDSRLLFA